MKSNLSPSQFATSFLINQDIEGEITEFTAIKAGSISRRIDVRGWEGDDCIFKRVECGQFKEEKGNDYTVNVFDVPGHTVGFPITVSFVRPTTCA